MELKLQNGEPLLEFRLAYLRAIARSWQSEAYRDKLVDLNDIQPELVKEFGLRTVWPNLNIALFRSDIPAKQTQWKPELTAGWIGLDDQFHIVLPQAPAEAEASEALARFYQIYPDFLGPVASVSMSKEHQAPVTNDLEHAHTMVSAAMPTGLGIPGGGPDSLLAFGGVVLRAIALAWTEPQFKAELLHPAGGDAAAVLSQWLGYNNPFNFQIHFVDSPALTWTDGKWNLRNPETGELIKNKIVLNYPNAPTPASLQPIALTSYNNTGEAYPFTC